MPSEKMNEPEISGHSSIDADITSAWLRWVSQRSWRAEIARRLPQRAVTKLIKITTKVTGPESAQSYDSGYVSLDSNSTTEWASEWASDTCEALHNVQNEVNKQSFNQILEFEEHLIAGPQPLHDDTCLDGATRIFAQGNDQISQVYNYLHDGRSPTDSTTRQHDKRASSEASSQSGSSEDPSILLPEDDAWLILAHAKHQMMVSLMRDVYAMFNSQWTVEFRSQTGSQSTSPDAYSQNSSSSKRSSTRNGKRIAQDEDFHPSEANEEKKRKSNCPKSRDDRQGRMFACCFYKHDAQKYCSNSDTGTKYRSCAGPGFSKISVLKQHLRRLHPAPIYCPRCWLVMDSQTEMTLHANTEDRCERRDPIALEGVNDDKMRMITDTRGITWEGIYEIVFPGAPIPSPYYKADEVSAENVEPSSPRSEEWRNFETYSRTALPLLVEANLRAIVESQIAPIEERVRAMVVDIVRTCQSTVARNFNLMLAPTSLANDRTEPHSQIVALGESSANTRVEPARLPRNDTVDNPLDLYREPPHLNAEASGTTPGPASSVTGTQNPDSDSGYSSLPYSCACSCHDYLNTWNTANGRSSCQTCAYMHFDPGDLNNPDPGDSYSNFDFDEDATRL